MQHCIVVVILDACKMYKQWKHSANVEKYSKNEILVYTLVCECTYMAYTGVSVS